jgi:IS5 family transposase
LPLECKFRHPLEKYKLGNELLISVNEHLRRALRSRPARLSMRRSSGRRPEDGPEGSSGFFGMKAHFGVDSRTKTVHTVMVPAANGADRHALQSLLHGKERRVWGDRAYRRARKFGSRGDQRRRFRGNAQRRRQSRKSGGHSCLHSRYFRRS